MIHRPLGRTGMQVSPLGLGTVKIGRNAGVKYPAAFDLPDDASVVALLETAAECGINVIDTAPAYGTSETRLGALLPGPRDRWILMTKTGETFEREASAFDFSPEATRASVDRSLRRLQTDYLDVVLVHSDGRDLEIIEEAGTLDVLSDLKDQGQIRAFGMSTKTVAGGLAAIERCDVVMITYHIGYEDEAPVIDVARDRGVGVVIKKALGSGHLAVDEPAEVALRHVSSYPGVSSIIVGTINPQHLRANAAAVS